MKKVTDKQIYDFISYEILDTSTWLDFDNPNLTHLAESACQHFDDYINIDTIPIRYFEIAFDVSETLAQVGYFDKRESGLDIITPLRGFFSPNEVFYPFDQKGEN
jgi:hypothetical protein